MSNPDLITYMFAVDFILFILISQAGSTLNKIFDSIFVPPIFDIAILVVLTTYKKKNHKSVKKKEGETEELAN